MSDITNLKLSKTKFQNHIPGKDKLPDKTTDTINDPGHDLLKAKKYEV